MYSEHLKLSFSKSGQKVERRDVICVMKLSTTLRKKITGYFGYEKNVHIKCFNIRERGDCSGFRVLSLKECINYAMGCPRKKYPFEKKFVTSGKSFSNGR